MAYNAHMKRNTNFTDTSVVVAVRLPDHLRSQAKSRAANLDLTFSQLMRRAIRRELCRPQSDLAKEVAC